MTSQPYIITPDLESKRAVLRAAYAAGLQWASYGTIDIALEWLGTGCAPYHWSVYKGKLGAWIDMRQIPEPRTLCNSPAHFISCVKRIKQS